MTKISNKALRELNKALNAKIEKKAPSQTTVVQASVVNATEGDLWVKIDGSPTNTPCESSSVSVEVGDVVTVRIANGKATITGNISRQATNVSETNAIVAPVAKTAEVAKDTAEDAQENAEQAQQTAHTAYISADNAKTTADNAKTVADEAQSLANATNQHFWHADDGVHVTANTQEEWTGGDKTGANLLATSGGVLIRDGENPLTGMTPSGFSIYDGQGSADTNVIASFTSDGVQVGKDEQTRAEFTANAFKLVDKEGKNYVYISDLRDPETGVAEITEILTATKTSSAYKCTLSYPATSVTKVLVGTSTSTLTQITDFTASTNTVTYPLTYTDATVAQITYNTATSDAKAYTLGIRNTSSKLGLSSYALGNGVEASGLYSFAEGNYTYAVGKSSHAEGNSTWAEGTYSHAECSSTSALAYGSHAEGMKSVASGDGSHAEGYNCVSRGTYSHAEGQDTYATGTNSHSQNLSTYAYGDNQTAMGKYNIADNNNTYALIVGNGTSNARSNALTLDWEGNLSIAGTLTAASGGSTPTGTVNIFAGSTAPDGWLLCKGQAVSRTTYADLFAVIGTTYGAGNGSTTFTLPDLQGRAAIGSGTYYKEETSEGATYTLGEADGEMEHQLSTTEMPSHTHTQNAHTHTQTAHSHTPGDSANRFITFNYTATGGAAVGERRVAATSSSNYFAPVVANTNVDFMSGASTSSATPSITSATATNQNTGGGGYHNNMQPYLAMNYIIKY